MYLWNEGIPNEVRTNEEYPPEVRPNRPTYRPLGTKGMNPEYQDTWQRFMYNLNNIRGANKENDN